MARYGPQFGPDITFLGVDRCDWADPASYPDADVVIIGAPFDGGTSYRSGARFGPQYIRQTDYLPHDGSRPSLALRTDGLKDLRVYDAGDVEAQFMDAIDSDFDFFRLLKVSTRGLASNQRRLFKDGNEHPGASERKNRGRQRAVDLPGRCNTEAGQLCL